MDKAPFFSVIVPVYKVEEYLSRCVESVLTQSFSDYELILVDDGSPDRCPEICNAYEKMDSRVSVIHKANGGLSSARNRGLQSARGKYILFLDSDDFWIRDTALQDLYQLITREAPDVIVIKSVSFHQSDESFTENHYSVEDTGLLSDDYDDRFSQLVFAGAFQACAWNKVFARKLMDKRDLLFQEGIIAEDVDWAARLGLAAESISFLPEAVYGYRIGRPGAITSSLKQKNLIDTKWGIEQCVRFMREEERSETFRSAFFGYVAYRYVIWMAESFLVRDPQKRPLIQEMKGYAWLLRYDGMDRVHQVRKLYPAAGFSGTSMLLGLYYLYVQKKRESYGRKTHNLHAVL